MENKNSKKKELVKAFDIKELIKTWAKIEAAKQKIKYESADLLYQEKRKEYTDVLVDSKYHVTPRILRPNQAVKQGDGERKRRPDLDGQHAKITGGLSGTREIESTATLFNSRSVTFSKTLDVGLDIGVAYYAELGIHANVNLTKTNDKVESKEEVKRLKTRLDLKEGYDYEIKEEVFEMPYKEEIIKEIILEGRIPICFNGDFQYTDNGRDGKKHQLNFIPIADIISNLKGHDSLKQYDYEVDGKKVIFKFKESYEFVKYESQIDSISTLRQDTKTESAPLKKDESSKPQGHAEKTMHVAVVGEKGIVDGNVNSSPVIGFQFSEDMLESDEKVDRAVRLYQGATEKFKDFDVTTVRGAVKKDVTNSGATGANFVPQKSNKSETTTAASYKPVLQSTNTTEGKDIEKFCERIFNSIEDKLEGKFEKEVTSEKLKKIKETYFKELFKILSEGDCHIVFMNRCMGKNIDTLNNYAHSIAQTIVSHCHSLERFKIQPLWVEDGFNAIKEEAQLNASSFTAQLK